MNQITPEKLEEWNRIYHPGYADLPKWIAGIAAMGALAALLVKITWSVMW